MPEPFRLHRSDSFVDQRQRIFYAKCHKALDFGQNQKYSEQQGQKQNQKDVRGDDKRSDDSDDNSRRDQHNARDASGLFE